MFPFEDTVRYIENNLDRKITVEELARHSKYSKYHFCRLFKSSFGQTVGNFIKQQRLLRIIYNIQSGKRPIDCVVYYGYDTYAGFYKAFMGMFGCSPSVYVKEHYIHMPISIKEEEYMGTYEPERCAISLLEERDFAESLRFLTDERVREHLGGAISETDASRRLRFWLENNDSIHYTIRHRETGALMGIVAIAPHHNGIDKEVSYQFLPEYWGMGYATEALRWVLRHCRDELKLDHIVAETQKANKASCKLLERVGFKLHEELIRFGAEQCIFKHDLSEL